MRCDAVGVPVREEGLLFASCNARGYIVRVDHADLKTVRAKHDVVRETASSDSPASMALSTNETSAVVIPTGRPPTDGAHDITRYHELAKCSVQSIPHYQGPPRGVFAMFSMVPVSGCPERNSFRSLLDDWWSEIGGWT